MMLRSNIYTRLPYREIGKTVLATHKFSGIVCLCVAALGSMDRVYGTFLSGKTRCLNLHEFSGVSPKATRRDCLLHPPPLVDLTRYL
jgi:hypothetical protein